ncbi:DUF5986 family protein [Enterococcus olivae]
MNLAAATIKEQDIIKGILQAMSITEIDVIDDFEGSISKSNKNGIFFNVWARRSDFLDDYFEKFEDIEVFHIQRTKLWQIDPVFNRSTGNLYLLFTDKTLSQVKRKYLKKGTSTHYSFSFLLKNLELLPLDGENVELFTFPEDETAKEDQRRQKDIEKMIGRDAEHVKKVIMINVSYHESEAIAALVQEYTKNFELSTETDVSYMLNTSYFGDNNMEDEGIHPVELEQPLVKLKNREITKE